jgi:hypothetical protein
MNGCNPIRFEDGSRMKHVEEAAYLSRILTKHVNIASEASNRIALAMATLKSVDVFWNEEQCSLRNNLFMRSVQCRVWSLDCWMLRVAYAA